MRPRRPLPLPRLTGVLGLEVGGFALQRGRQVVKAERQLPLEGRVLLAEGRKSPERALTHQLLDGRVSAGDGVGPAGFWPLHGGRGALWGRGGARWEGRNRRGLVWGRKIKRLEVFLFRKTAEEEPSSAPWLYDLLEGVGAGFAPTFLLVRQLLVPLAAAAALLAAGGVASEGALTDERGAAGVEGGRHAALLLPPLLPLQTGGEGAAHGVAQPLPLSEENREGL